MSCGSGIPSLNGLLWCDRSLTCGGFPPEGIKSSPAPCPLSKPAPPPPRTPLPSITLHLASLLSPDSESSHPSTGLVGGTPILPTRSPGRCPPHSPVHLFSPLTISLLVHSCSSHHRAPPPLIIPLPPSAQGHLGPLVVADT